MLVISQIKIMKLLFLLCKNINYSIGISIILTNLFISFNFFKVTENFFNLPKKPTEDQKAHVGKWTTSFIYYLDNFINKGIDDRINLRLGQLGRHLAKDHNKEAKNNNKKVKRK